MINRKITNSKNKKAEVFGMSFSMIFSIILIAVFVAAAFIGIRSWLNTQKNIQVGLFMDDLQKEVDNAWGASESFSTIYKGFLPSGIQSVCFINWSAKSGNLSSSEKKIYDELRRTHLDYKKNFYVYSPNTDFYLTSREIKHIDLTKKNIVCINAVKNQASIKITKRFENPLVEVSA